ncbi:unnamed protein product [Rhizoctonia solani]|uniref:Uncharacterized protein n=1 Tax=Rhizoctonia solani TaxID=456999 RepID=A0A8H2XWW5_9AGAM|nr:unnamed protein product [Rhizoctonia solani]
MFATKYRQVPRQPPYVNKKGTNVTPGKSGPRTGLPSAPSPPSNSDNAIRSLSKSVQWGESDSDEEGRISPGSYSVGSSKPHLKPVLKYHKLHAVNMPSLYDKNTLKVASLTAMDSILCDLVKCLKNSKCPSELDFTTNTGPTIVLADTDRNKTFVRQRHKLNKLGKRLADIPIHGDTQLETKRNTINAGINRALFRMEEHQIKLGMKFICTALDELTSEVHICVEGFVYPCELDFLEDCQDGMVLLRTERNKSFIYQLRILSLFRMKLSQIPEYHEEKLKDKRRAVAAEIERNLDRMKDYQLGLYRRQFTKASQPCRA